MSSVTIRDNKTNKTISTYDSGFCPRVGDKFTRHNVHYSVMSLDFEVTSYGGLKPIVYVEEVEQIKKVPTHNVDQKQLKRIGKVIQLAQKAVEQSLDGEVPRMGPLDLALQKLTEEDGVLLGLSDD